MIRKLQVIINYLSFCLLLLTGNDGFGQNMALDWAKSIGGKSPYGDEAFSIAVDKDGNTYVAGYFRDTADFDPGPGTYNLVARGMADIYAVKLDPAGNFIWARQFGSPAADFFSIEFGYSIAVDTFGNVLVAGIFSDTADFDPGPGTYELVCNGGQGDAFVVKLDGNGDFMWAAAWGGSKTDNVQKVLTDSAGNVYMTGKFGGSVDFDPGAGSSMLVSGGFGGDIYVSKLHPDGTFVWASQVFASGICDASGMVRDDEGNLYVCGFSRVVPPAGASWWGSGSTTFAWKLDSSGALVWQYQFDDDVSPTDLSTAIALDPAGYLYITGELRGPMDADPGPGFDTLTSAGATDIYVLKLDTAANVVWVKRIGDTLADAGRGVALDESGNIYITGEFSGTVDFDPGPGMANLSAEGEDNNADVFLLKLDSSGGYQWAYRMGAEGHESGNDLTIGQHGTVYTTGDFGGFVATSICDFDPGPGELNLSTAGYFDVFIQKLLCNDTTSFLIADTVCDSYTLNGETYTEAGTYTQIRPNAAGCDSIITLQLTISEPNPIITVDEFILSTTLPYTSYQWFLDGTMIGGATQATYTVTENGDYTVAVTNEHGCADTSEIYTVTNVTGIEDAPMLAGRVNVYPNPAQDQVFIQSPVAVDVAISSMDGRLIRKVSDAKSFSVADLAAGIYLLRITDKDGILIKAEKLVRSIQ